MADPTPPARPKFRLGLAQALALLLAAQVALTVIAMATAIAFSLGHGFSIYLRARDAEMLAGFVEICATSIKESPHHGAMPQAADFGDALVRFARLRGLRPTPLRGLPPPLPPAQPRDAAPPGFARPGHLQPFPPPPLGALPPPPIGQPPPGLRPGDAAPFPPPPQLPDSPPSNPDFGQPGPPDGFGPRLSIWDASGKLIFGLNRPIGPDTLVRPLPLANGQTLRLSLAPEPAPAGVEAAFLQSQYQRIALVSALLLGFAISLGLWLATRWARPLQAIRAATTRIARGDFSARLGEAGPQDIAATIANINAMAASLQNLEQTRRSWLAQISHELRTPLTVLRGELEALQDGVRPLGPQAIASLREEAEALAGLVEDLHLLAMSDLGRLPCHFQPEDPAQLLARACARFAPEAKARGLTLTMMPPEAAGEANWDGRRIAQLLANLLANSLRYTDAPGEIRLRLTQDATHLRFVVEDSAPGVAPAHLPRLLEPFYRQDAARSRAQGGSGLGLAVCTAIASAHGGRIELAPSPLGGLKASLILPRNPPAS